MGPSLLQACCVGDMACNKTAAVQDAVVYNIHDIANHTNRGAGRVISGTS